MAFVPLTPEQSAIATQQLQAQQQAPVLQQQNVDAPREDPTEPLDLLGAFQAGFQRLEANLSEYDVAAMEGQGFKTASRFAQRRNQRKAEEAMRWQQTHAAGADPWSLAGIAENIVQVVPEMAGAVATSGVLPALSAAGEIHREQAPGDKSWLTAGLGGAAIGAAERVGAGRTLAPLLRGQVARKGVGQVVGDVAKTMGTEGLTEGAQSVIQQAATTGDVDLGQAAGEAAYGGVLGGIIHTGAKTGKKAFRAGVTDVPTDLPDEALPELPTYDTPGGAVATSKQAAIADMANAGIMPNQTELADAGVKDNASFLSKAFHTTRGATFSGKFGIQKETDAKLQLLQKRAQDVETTFDQVNHYINEEVDTLEKLKRKADKEESRVLSNQIKGYQELQKQTNEARTRMSSALVARTGQSADFDQQLNDLSAKLEESGFKDVPNLLENYNRARGLGEILQSSIGNLESVGGGQYRKMGSELPTAMVPLGTFATLGPMGEVAGFVGERIRKGIQDKRISNLQSRLPASAPLSRAGVVERGDIAEISRAKAEEEAAAKAQADAELKAATTPDKTEATLDEQHAKIATAMSEANYSDADIDQALSGVTEPLTKTQLARRINKFKKEATEVKAKAKLATRKPTTESVEAKLDKQKAKIRKAMSEAEYVDADIDKAISAIKEPMSEDSLTKRLEGFKKRKKARLEAKKPKAPVTPQAKAKPLEQRPGEAKKEQAAMIQKQADDIDEALRKKGVNPDDRDKVVEGIDKVLTKRQFNRVVDEAVEKYGSEPKAVTEARKQVDKVVANKSADFDKIVKEMEKLSEVVKAAKMKLEPTEVKRLAAAKKARSIAKRLDKAAEGSDDATLWREDVQDVWSAAGSNKSDVATTLWKTYSNVKRPSELPSREKAKKEADKAKERKGRLYKYA